jgi:hypothetical protein
MSAARVQPEGRQSAARAPMSASAHERRRRPGVRAT